MNILSSPVLHRVLHNMQDIFHLDRLLSILMLKIKRIEVKYALIELKYIFTNVSPACFILY